MQNIDDIMKTRIQELLAPAKIVKVITEEANDHDGDPILNITVVFTAENDRLDPEKVLSLVRHLHEPLSAWSTDRYPVLTFMTPEEADFVAA